MASGLLQSQSAIEAAPEAAQLRVDPRQRIFGGWRATPNYRRWSTLIALSLAVHLSLLAGVDLLETHPPHPLAIAQAIAVDLVTAPPPGLPPMPQQGGAQDKGAQDKGAQNKTAQPNSSPPPASETNPNDPPAKAAIPAQPAAQRPNGQSASGQDGTQPKTEAPLRQARRQIVAPNPVAPNPAAPNPGAPSGAPAVKPTTTEKPASPPPQAAAPKPSVPEPGPAQPQPKPQSAPQQPPMLPAFAAMPVPSVAPSPLRTLPATQAPQQTAGAPPPLQDMPQMSDTYQAVAVPAPTQDGDLIVAYQTLVFSKLELAKEFPEEARKRHAHGTAVISFALDDQGRVTRVSLLKSSGDPALDAESLALVHRAAPFPAPPPGAKRDFAAEIDFNPDQ